MTVTPLPRHPFVKATLQRAVRDLLRDKHNHSTPGELLGCPECMARFWVCLGNAAPVPWIGSV